MIASKYSHLLSEIERIITSIDAEESKTTSGTNYSTAKLNNIFKKQFETYGWVEYKVKCENATSYNTSSYNSKLKVDNKSTFRVIDYVKEKLGVEAYFGKFPINNIEALMIIFRNLGVIDVGIGILPIRQFADDMSTGVSYFEQFVWDLEKRGVSNIDVPVMIIGVDAN